MICVDILIQGIFCNRNMGTQGSEWEQNEYNFVMVLMDVNQVRAA